ncbi:MAG: peptide-methionine (S)-S-oxide reductase MsrA [Alkalispirochaetaceae bacterium]
MKRVGSLLLLLLFGLLGTTLWAEESAKATFAGGCFWCMEEAFDKVDGVSETISGYAGGDVADPTYEQVTSGNTGHYEVLQVTYDPDVVSYEELLYHFWRNVDPVDGGGQFCDRGSQYLSAIFYHDRRQERLARNSLRELESSDRFSRPIATDIIELDEFYPAEGYHQNYYERNPLRYNFYKTACGREARLRSVWGEEAGGVEG